MSQTPGQPTRAPGSFSPAIPASTSTIPRRPVQRIASSPDEEAGPLTVAKQRAPALQNAPAPPRPLYAASAQANTSTSSLQNFSRPTPTPLRTDLPQTQTQRAGSPLTASAKSPDSSVHGTPHRGHGRKHSKTQGSFEPYLPTAAFSNMGNMGNLDKALSASQIAAQAAMQHQAQHVRQRSQTIPIPEDTKSNTGRSMRAPTSPPLLNLTEASAPREPSFGGQIYHNGLLGGHGAAQTAANAAFPKSPGSSPVLPPTDHEQHRLQAEKPKAEKPKVKLFSRPARIGISKDKDGKAGALPSPSKMASYSLGALSRGNASTNNLADNLSSAASIYSMANSSSATIRADQPEKEKDKEKKHHFLSRQKHKLSSKDDYHLPLSSAASNSKPVDPSAPSSLYNFNLPQSPGPNSTSFAKSMSGLDLRHGGRALREKKKEEKGDALRETELSYQNSNDWPGPSSLGSAGASSHLASATGPFGHPTAATDIQDFAKFGLANMGPDDAWPCLKAKLLVIFEGEDLRLPVEDFNRLVSTHFQRCLQKRAPNIIIDDLRDLLTTGFSLLDQTLRRTPDERLIPHLVEMWLFTFTSILPYVQAVFLPLDLEFSGNGPLMSPEQAREFWGALPASTASYIGTSVPASQGLEVRRIVLIAYRDTIILPRFDTLKTLFSRLSLDSIALSIPSSDTLSTSPDSFSNISGGRPSTAMSLDPSQASYGSQSTTLLGGGSSGDGSGNRSRTISNVSHGSDSILSGLGINVPPPPARPFTPSSTHPFAQTSHGNRGARERNVEDSSNRVTELVGRMLQCMSVLSSVGGTPGSASTGAGAGADQDSQQKMEELCRGLKLNWLGRGRMGRNRRGLVGARVPGGSKGQESRPEGITV